MKSLADQMSVYQRYHTKTITKATHFIGVPMIIFSVLIVLGWVHVEIPNLFATRLSWLALIVAGAYYLMLDILVAAPLIIVLMMMTILANIISGGGITMSSVYWFLFMFVVGWIIQFVGHFFEKKKPAFADNLFQLLVAPIFLTAEILFMLGVKRDLQDAVLLKAKQSQDAANE